MEQHKISISVAFATPEKQLEIPLKLEKSCTIAMAIKRSGILEQFLQIDFAQNKVGIYGKLAKLDALMQEGDRVEIYRSLILDPKAARLQRVRG